MDKKILAIMPISIGGRLTTSSIIDGFKLNDYCVDVFDELEETKFDLDGNYKYIVGYGFSPIVFSKENNFNLPIIAYFSDVIQSKAAGEGWDKYQNELNQSNIHVFYWDRQLAREGNWNYQPHFVNCNIYKNITEPTNDIMFMGRFDTEIRLKTFIQLNKKLPNLRFKWYAIEKHFIDALSRCSDDFDKKIIQKAYSGFIDTEIKMANAINDSKIVYNINAQGKTSLNYRTFQVMACERLLISDKREELDLFNNILPVYDDISSLCELIKFYISNKNEYNKITKLSREIILKNHDSIKCIKNMLNIIEN